MKQLICDAFCASLEVRSVPAGYAVCTPYSNADGDPLLLYFVRDGSHRWRIEDDGSQVPLLEANGVDLSGRARGEVFDTLLVEYGVSFDKDTRTLHSPSLAEAELGSAAVRFAALLLRLQDLALLSPQITRNNFREDALAALHAAFDGRAHMAEHAAISPELVGQEADVVITAPIPSAAPVAIYFGTSEERALQALVVKMEAERYREIAASIVLMVERSKENPVKGATLGLAMSRLDAVVSFRDSQQDTMDKISRVIGVNGPLRRVLQ